MVKLEEFFENSDKVFLAYKKMIESIVWEDKDFMAHNTIKQIHEFTNNFTTEHAEKDILALRDSMLGLKKQHTDTTEKEGEVNITEGKMSFRDQLICEIRRKYTFNEDDYAVIKNEMRSQFVGHNAKTFVFKVISDCSKSPKLCSDDDSAHIVLGDCYCAELENFLESNDFYVSKEEYKDYDYYIHVSLDE